MPAPYRSFITLLLTASVMHAIAQTWEPMGPTVPPSETYAQNGQGILKWAEFHPGDPNTIWVSGAGGLWKTTDHGATWSCLTDGVGLNEAKGIAVNPADPDSIFLVSGSNVNFGTVLLYTTADGGATWNNSSLNATPGLWFISAVLIPPNASQVVIASTNLGIHRSEDNGATWNLQASGFFRHCFQNPATPDIVYADTWGTPVHFYRSTDQGVTWEETFVLTSPTIDRIEYAVSPADPDLIQVVTSRTDQGLDGLYRSTDAGLSFEQYLEGDCMNNLLSYDEEFEMCGGQATHDLTIMISTTDANTLFVGGIFTVKSTDGGATWALNNSPDLHHVHVDQQMMRTNPLTQEIYLTNDGGVYRSGDDGLTWENISPGLNNLQILRMGVPGNHPHERVMIGQADNGIKFQQGGVWGNGPTGDGLTCLYDPIDTNVFYCGWQGGGMAKTTNNGTTFIPCSPISGFGPFYSDFILDPLDHNSLYFTGSGTHVSHDAADTWTPLPNSMGNGPIGIAYVGVTRHIITADYGNVYRTVDEGLNWATIGDPEMSDATLIDLAVWPNDPQRIWVSGYNLIAGKKVWYTADGGLSWTNISGSLPNAHVHAVLPVDDGNGGLFAATGQGVFYRDEITNDWVPYGADMPLMAVKDLGINCALQTLYAGTFGRGLWKTDVTVNCDLSTVVATTQVTERASLHPNPSNGRFTLNYDLSAPNSVFRIMSLTGKVTHQSRLSGLEGWQEVNVPELSEGLYTWEVRANGSILHTGKVSIVK